MKDINYMEKKELLINLSVSVFTFLIIFAGITAYEYYLRYKHPDYLEEISLDDLNYKVIGYFLH